MVVNLDLTEKTIDCFNECAKKGNYEKFVDENQKFIRTLSDNLKKVKFPVKEGISDMVSQNCKFYMDYLTKWNPRDPRGVVPGTTLLERHTPKLVDDLKRALSMRNWDKFYSEYYPMADFMINEARKQGVLDFQIESGSGIFESFQERDLVVASMQNDTNDRIWEHQNTSLETKNSGERILKVVPNPESHHPGTIKVNSPIDTDPVTNNFVLDNSTSSLQWSKDQILSDVDRKIKKQLDDMKQTFQKDLEENVEKFLLEIEDSVGHAIETNEAKKTELENTRKQEMDDLKLWFKVRATAIEEKIDKICEELRNEQNEANRRMEDKLNNLIEIFNETMFSTTTKSPEPTIETFNQELRNDQILNGTIIENQKVSIANPIPMESLPEVSSSHETDHIDREINGANQEELVPEQSEVFDKVSDSEDVSEREDFKQEQKDSSKNSNTSEVPDGEEMKTETSGGSADSNQHSGSSISVESIPEAIRNDQLAQEVNDPDIDPNGVNQEEHDSSDESEEEDVSEMSISVESIPAAIENEHVNPEINEQDLDEPLGPDGANEEEHDSSDESEEEDIQQLLAEQARVHEEELRTMREARLQRNQLAAEERRELAANISAGRNLFR